MKKQGKIGVTTENIFPIIKKFLYSEHDIFLRELVANAVDATSKLQTIAKRDSSTGELGTLDIRLSVDKEAKTLTIEDKGIGMTADEVEQYINQIAFSGAEDFLKKYEGNDHAIIGHFGLGFYSAFMVAHEVEIDTLSYQPGAEAVHWRCDGSPNYTLSAGERTQRGTTITLHLDDDSLEFLEPHRIGSLLDKYCRFLPIPIFFGKEQEWKEGKMVDTDRDKQINNTAPLWTKTPADCESEEYKKFYQELYPMSEEPLFWIHLNVDYPFTLKGILYFPVVKPHVELQKNRIQLYCNQVFVTDHLEDIVPEWLTLMEGVIDSPDIPLNVSRSYLQNDANAKRIARHISKKVSDKLAELFEQDRTGYQDKWNSIGLFVQYGMLTDEKAYDRLKEIALVQDTEGKYFTAKEYLQLIEGSQTDKNGKRVLLYTTNATEQYLAIEQAKERGYNVILAEGPLALPFLSQWEEKGEKLSVVRVDSDSIDRLIEIDHSSETTLSAAEEQRLIALFEAVAPTQEGRHFSVSVTKTARSTDNPAELVQNEWMRRMKEMSRYQRGASFYDSMPDSLSFVINAAHPLVQSLLTDLDKACGADLTHLEQEQAEAKDAREKLINEIGSTPEDEISAEQKELRKSLTERIDNSHRQLEERLEIYAKDLPAIEQLWDLALLSRGMLDGKRLMAFMKRSQEMLTTQNSK